MKLDVCNVLKTTKR